MRVKCILFVVMFFMCGFWHAEAEAVVFLHEILADPAPGLAGDANNDGVRSSTEDEFVEIFNLSANSRDISGWSIRDAVIQRHIFGINSIIQSNSAFVVFGGGSPNLPSIDWQTASSTTLGLNNGGDTITLLDENDQFIDQVIFGGEADNNQSLARSPEGSQGNYIKHTLLANAGGKLFSPGYLINDIPIQINNIPPQSSTVMPEPMTLMTFMAGFGAMFWRKKRGQSPITKIN